MSQALVCDTETFRLSITGRATKNIQGVPQFDFAAYWGICSFYHVTDLKAFYYFQHQLFFPTFVKYSVANKYM